MTLPLPFRVHFKISVLTCKGVDGQTPVNLSNHTSLSLSMFTKLTFVITFIILITKGGQAFQVE